MKKNHHYMAVVLFTFLLAACAGNEEVAGSAGSVANYSVTDRLLIKSADINIEVSTPEKTATEIQDLVSQEQGYINSIRDYDKTNISIAVKIPSKNFESFIEKISGKGKVLSKSIRVTDVTDEMVDIEARVTNLIALREKFRKLLDKAVDVKDILSIESELNRIQTEIDTIESRRKSLKNQIAMSDVDIRVTQSTIYGPLGYVGKGIYWVFKKLFVIN